MDPDSRVSCASISHMHVEWEDSEGDFCIEHGFEVVSAHADATFVMHQTSEPWMLGGIPGCEFPRGLPSKST